MRAFATLPVRILCCVILGGCGAVGEPLYPALKIPTRVTDLTAVERGDRIDIHFTIPPLTTEGLAIKQIGSVELRIGPSSATPIQRERTGPTGQPADGCARARSARSSHSQRRPPQAFIGKDVVVRVRLANTKGRNSDWSNFATLSVEPPLAKPANFKAEAGPQGVALTWNAPQAQQFRVYRKAGEETDAFPAGNRRPNRNIWTPPRNTERLTNTTSKASMTRLRATWPDPRRITPKDVFPPRVPAGLTASAGLGAIELAWERNTEPDFKRYRVYPIRSRRRPSSKSLTASKRPAIRTTKLNPASSIVIAWPPWTRPETTANLAIR